MKKETITAREQRRLIGKGVDTVMRTTPEEVIGEGIGDGNHD